MSGDVVDRAKAALEGVTEGPWVWDLPERGDDALRSTTAITPYNNGYIDRDGRSGYASFVLSGDWHNDDTAGISGSAADQSFIAEARALIPELVEEVERLRAVAAALDMVPEYARGWTAQNGERQHATPKSTLNAALLSGSTIKVDPVEVRWCTPWAPM